MNKLFTKIATAFVGIAMAIGVGVAVGSGNNAVSLHAANGDTHSITGFTGEGAGTVINNGTTPSSISVSDPGYTIKQVIIGWKHNKGTGHSITANVSVGSTSLGSGTVGGQSTTTTTTIGNGTQSLTGAVSITWSSSLTGSGHGTLYINTLTFVEGSGSSKTLSSIAISGDMTTKSYTIEDSWSFAGLTVTGTYSDSSTANLTEAASFKLYESSGTTEKSTPNALGVGSNQSVKVMATVNSVKSSKYSITGITVIKPDYTNTSSLEEGEYFIKYENNYFTGVISSGHGSSSTSKPGDAGKFTFTLVGNDKWSLVNKNGDRLGFSGNNTGAFTYGSNYTFTVSNTSTSGVYTIRSLDQATRYIGWYSSGSEFRSYTDSSPITLESTTVKYTVSYSGNNNTSGTAPDDSQYVENSTVTVATNSGNLAKTGYTFGGWNTNAAGTGTTYAAGTGTFPITANTTLHAKWNPTTYNITYSLDGGTHGTNHPTSGTYDTAFAVSAPTREGYTFDGWTVTGGLNISTAKWGTTSSPATAISSTSTKCINGANDVYFKNINPTSSAVTLTANWTIITCKVSGSVSHGSLDPANSTVNYGSSLTVTIEPDDGYGVPTSVSVDGTVSYSYSDGEISLTNIRSAITITASCVALATEYTVTYNANGGTIEGDDEEEVIEGGHPSFPTPTWSGHNFKGWQVNGSGTAYTDPTTYTVEGDVTFVASWKAVYTVSFSSAGGSLTPASKLVEDGSTFTFPSAGTKEHYNFDGWSSNGSEPYYAVDATSPAVTGNITYTAHWTEHTKFTVTYNANSGTVSPASEDVYDGGHPSLPTPTRDGYKFDGWQINGAGDYITSSYVVTSAITLVAHWTKVTLTTDTLTRETTGITSGSTTYSDWSDKISNSYAVYAGSSAGGNDSIQIRSKNSDSGVYTTTSGGIIKSVSIVFDSHTSSGRSASIYGKNTAYESASDLFNDGKQGTLLGSINCDTPTTLNVTGDYAYIGIRSTSDALYISSITIVWEGEARPASAYTVTYNSNGGTGTLTDEDSPYAPGSTVTVLANTYTKEGYSFVNWNTKDDGTGTPYDAGDTFTISENTTLYATWEEEGGGGSATKTRCYHLVTSTSDLVAGAKYIITNDVATESGFFALAGQKTNNRDAEPIASQKTGVAQVSSSAVEIITLGGTSGAWTLGVTGGYLYAAGSDKNYLKTREENSDKNSEWNISISDGVASIVAQGTNRSVMQYNYNGGEDKALFSCYSTASQDAVYLYRLDFGETLLANITCDGDGGHSMPDGYTWNTDLQGVYNDLPLSEKTALASASSAGLTRYDYIVGKYNPNKLTDASQTNYVHFITGRNVSAIGNGRIMIQLLSSQTTNASLIVIVTVGVAGLAIGGYFLLRKKKEE